MRSSLLPIMISVAVSCSLQSQSSKPDAKVEGSLKTRSAFAKLDVQLAGSRVVVHIAVKNPSPDAILFLEKKKIVVSPPVRSNLFHVWCEGSEIQYIGPLAKTKPPGREDYFRVAPGAEIKGFADITDLYAFRPGAHTYTVAYDAFHGDPNIEAKLLEITSLPTEVRLHR